MPAISVEGITKRFGDREILRGISFEALPGDIVAVIGPSGCGKTTLLRCILGELEPDGGRILIDGRDVTHKKVWKRGVGIVYQRYALFPHMTVAENVGYGLRVRREPNAKIQARTKELLEMVHLTGKEDMFPERLSGGERQRVAVARALAVEPQILLLDEAFTALDATTRHKVIQEVRAIVKRLKVTTILVTHDQEEAFLLANRVIVLNQGQVVVDGAPAEVMRAEHPFIKDFVKMALFHHGTVESDPRGYLFVGLENGSRIPINIPNVKPGDAVQVMVKKTGETESIEVWPRQYFEVVE
jgi:ABC-type Fe3+/spermidine/putrescine transport system ATPase subunit